MNKFNNIAELVKERRIAKNMSQAELAHSLGYLNGQFISNAERGLCSLPLKKILKFSLLTKTPWLSIKAALIADYGARVDDAFNGSVIID